MPKIPKTRPIRLVRKSRTHGVCMTWKATYESGFPTRMPEIITRIAQSSTRPVLRRGSRAAAVDVAAARPRTRVAAAAVALLPLEVVDRLAAADPAGLAEIFPSCA